MNDSLTSIASPDAKEVINSLQCIQDELKAPKGQYNKFGKYKYRSCEDIMEAVKPLAKKYGCVLHISDEIEVKGDRYYLKATATLIHSSGHLISASSLAREPLTKKGMDESQITGASSSYARKYALNGLFAIDDTKDSDASNKPEETRAATVANDYKAMSKELWKELTAMKDSDIDQAVSRVVHDHKDAQDKRGLYLDLSDILNRAVEKTQ